MTERAIYFECIKDEPLRAQAGDADSLEPNLGLISTT